MINSEVMKDSRVTFPIDLVYMWVDGSDPQWRAKRNSYLGTQSDGAPLVEARWIDNEELRYSLRSVECYAPWVNHIYIVTDGQCPAWLNTAHPKVTIVDHRAIAPEDALPLFNSHAIESCIYKIPNLSEHFILGNDDTLFAQSVTPEHFFHADGRPIVRLSGQRFSRAKAQRKGLYERVVAHMQELIKERYGRDICHAPHHNFDAYRRSDFERAVAIMPEQWRDTTYSRFRSDSDMQRCYVSYWSVVGGGATLRLVGRYNRTKGLLGAIKALFVGRYAADSRCIPLAERDYDRVLSKYNPLMICMNDGETTTDDDRRRLVEFLDRRYPNKSSFERL